MVKTRKEESEFVPGRGDVVWLNFTPQSGHEQSGRRPALVISPRSYNQITGLAILCPITSHIKDYPFDVRIPDNLGISGVILSDQVKNLDWKTRKAELICKLPAAALTETLNKIKVLIEG